ncbi:MAG: rhomboid family intramembrane serine protease [Phycisphaerae bacterium]|nr:rhomboid family intramembrane serine protease [Phycisphaerae bacterium]
MLIIPYELDVPFERTPFVNWLLVASIIAVFVPQVLVMLNAPNEEAAFGPFKEYVLDGFSVRGLVGHMWLHGGIVHLIGNLIFLWVFGNAVCQKMGNVLYFPVYLFVGLFAGITHLLFDGGPAVGASGAINGVVGIYLMFFPVHDMTCLWMFMLRFGTFTISGYWMILLWLGFDIMGVMTSGDGVAYFAHLGGFAAGVGVGFGLLATNVVKTDDFDETLLQILTRGKREKAEAERRTLSDFEIQERIDRKRYGALDGAQKSAVHTEELLQQPNRPPKVVKSADGMIRFYCGCGQRIKMPVKHAGRTAKCPTCHGSLTIPGSP